MRPEALTAFLFDLDGTLVDSMPDITAALNRLLARDGHPPYAPEEVQAMVGDGVVQLVGRAFAGRGAVPSEDAVDRFRGDYLERCLEGTRPYDGIPELLAALAARRPRPSVALVTNKPQAISERVVSGLGLAPFFDLVLAPERVSKRKPDPAHVLEACALLGCRPETAVMIGDGTTDVLAGRHAGAATVAVLWGYRSRAELAQARPDHVASNVAELAELLGVSLRRPPGPAW